MKVRDILYGPLKESFRKCASKSSPVPSAPSSHDHIDPSQAVYNGRPASDFVLRRDRKPGEDRDVFLLGTKETAAQFSVSKFKSGDGTFSIAPKMFYQVRNFLYVYSFYI